MRNRPQTSSLRREESHAVDLATLDPEEDKARLFGSIASTRPTVGHTSKSILTSPSAVTLLRDSLLKPGFSSTLEESKSRFSDFISSDTPAYLASSKFAAKRYEYGQSDLFKTQQLVASDAAFGRCSEVVQSSSQKLTTLSSRKFDVGLLMNDRKLLATTVLKDRPAGLAFGSGGSKTCLQKPVRVVNVDSQQNSVKKAPAATTTSKKALPPICTDGLLPISYPKGDYGNLKIQENGSVLLDFFERKLKVLINRECITVEHSDAEQRRVQMYSRTDLPSRYHKLYMLAYDATNCLARVSRTKSAQPATSSSKEEQQESNDSKLVASSSPKQRPATPLVKAASSAEQRHLPGVLPRPSTEPDPVDHKSRFPGHSTVSLNKSLYRKAVIQPF